MNRTDDSSSGKRRVSLPIFNDPAGGAVAAADLTPRPWMSVAEHRMPAMVDATVAQEFPDGADSPPGSDGVSRRDFVQLLGASMALAGVAGCKKPPERIMPYARRPPEVTPGNALHFATASSLGGYARGLLVESHEGRPTKVEGNPDHPDSRGAASVFDQAMILSLYDPGRAKTLRFDGAPMAWRSLHPALLALARTHQADGGARLRFLLEPTSSPLLASLRARIAAAYPHARFFSWSAGAGDAEGEGARIAFGKSLDTRYDMNAAKVIVDLDADLLGSGSSWVRHAAGFAAHREPGAGMNRLYVAEPAFTVTGTAADHRLRVRSSEIAELAAALAAELARAGVADMAPYAGAAHGAARPERAKWIAALAKDLARHRGACVVAAGPRQPAGVHALVHAMNAALGNVGTTVFHHAPSLVETESGVSGLRALAGEIAAGKVDTLVVTACNPVYTAPVDVPLADLFARVPHVIYTSLFEDETAASAKTFIPALHPLESWDDVRGTDGTASIIQPLIAPLYGGMTAAEILAGLLGESEKGAYELLRAQWKDKAGALSFETAWETWLADGVIPGTAAAPEQPAVQSAMVLAAATSSAGRRKEGTELVFALCAKVHDGRFGNNAWLQELPDPVTKITWGNAALLSPATAGKLGVELASLGSLASRPGETDVVVLEYRGKKIEAPAYVVPGVADDTVVLSLGYGRSASAESIAKDVGFNAGALRHGDALWFDNGIAVRPAGRKQQLAITQDHWRMEGRDLAIEVRPEEFAKHETAIDRNKGELATIHEKWNYQIDELHENKPALENSWGMAIDLNKCTGCNACMVACQSENNVPVVGQYQVVRGREMHWVRIDRYFTGTEDDPSVVTQPVACVQCESAPCEYVCPVNATVHSDEGLNEMVYNRCVGTRYCSNNCPYKVRRFNFLHYHGDLDPVSKMRMNPDVTVRSRGVMEKCSYCVQRIERKRIDARVAGHPIKDGDIETACQQTCPSQAIVFGNLNDPRSRVSKLHGDRRRYDLLHELNTRPRTVYLARVRNPNPELA